MPRVRTRARTTKPYSSVVWRYFHVRDPSNEHLVSCILCGREYTRDIGGSTSNLLHHIKSAHADEDPPPIPESQRVRKLTRPVSTSDSDSESVPVKAKRQRTNLSFVWSYFVKPTSPHQPCSCNICGAIFKYSYGPGDKSTTRLWLHLKRKHPDEFLEGQRLTAERGGGGRKSSQSNVLKVSPKDSEDDSNDGEEDDSNLETVVLKQEPVVTKTRTSKATKTKGKRKDVTSSNASTSASASFKAKKSLEFKKKAYIDALVVQVITSELQPCSFVENENLRALVKSLDPHYDLPSYDKLSQEILPSTYEAVKQDVKLSLQLANKVAITVDSWVSWSSQQYVTVTAHFFSMSWDKKVLVLSTFQITNNMTAADTTAELQKIFAHWEIEGKICSVVTDSSSIISEAVQNLEMQQVPCFVHSLDRAVKEALKSAHDVVTIASRVRGIASYFQYSSYGVNMLKEIQVQGGNGPMKMLVKDEEARWMSTLDMFRCYIEQHEVISAALCFLSKAGDCITEGEVDIMKKVVETLEPFQLAANELCVENGATLSTMIPILKQLQECLVELHYQDFPLTAVLLRDINRLFLSLETNFIVGAATVLDPRFKYLSFDDPDKVKNIESRLTSMLSKMFESVSDDADDSSVVQEQTERPRKSLWNRFDSKVNDLLVASSPARNGPMIELRRYFESRQLRRQEVHPFEWWKANEKVFPNLAKLAQQFLAVPATSVPAAYIFSKDSEAFLAKRSCLEEGVIDKMIFLHKNYTNTNTVQST